jgi:hypothetical protein
MHSPLFIFMKKRFDRFSIPITFRIEMGYPKARAVRDSVAPRLASHRPRKQTVILD